MNRRQVLGAVGGLGAPLSGCLGFGGPFGGSSDPSQPPSTSSPSSPTPSPTVVSGVEVPPCPERPDPLTRESVVRFATRFERAYLTRVTLQGKYVDITSLSVRTEDPEAEATGDGWVVRFAVVGPAYRYRPAGSTATVHVDPGVTTAHYLVTDETVRRALSPETVDPREYGFVVRCPP